MKYYITGDIHGNLDRLDNLAFISEGDRKNITLIILGDCGFNYFMNIKDMILKEQANSYGFTLFCIKGNHELHPDQIPSYKTKIWNGAPVYYEEDFPNLLFAKDGEIYTIAGRKVFVMGGAYSVDKEYRLLYGYHWFNTEQPSEKIKMFALKNLDKNGWRTNIVLTHTAPLKSQPVHMFDPFVIQDTVDKSTEEFLDEISDKLSFDKWYFGHYHGEWINGKYEMLFAKIEYLFEEKEE